jgi:hypothetical protein
MHFFNGERLTADDLNFLDHAENTLRWLHTRFLHGWGIATGLGVAGKSGAQSVSVAPGMAIDALGREIILTSALTFPIPVISGGVETMYYLTAAYQGDAAQQVLEQRLGVCSAGGTARLANAPLIQWETAAKVTEGLQLILATAWIKNCKLSRDVSGASRRLLAPPSTPPIGSGITDAAATAWTPWPVGFIVLGYTAQVDTSAAQFSGIPHYVAQVVGEMYLPGAPGPLLAVPQTAILNPTATGFTFQVTLAPGAPAGVPVNPPVLLEPGGPALLQNSLHWQIAWMGVQS